MISLDVSWGPFFIVFGVVALVIIAIVAAIIILVVFMVRNDTRKGQLNKEPLPQPSAGSAQPDEKK